MTRYYLIFALLLVTQAAMPQQFSTRNGFIGFYSKTPLEDIAAENRQVYATIDVGNKKLAFLLLLKGFRFQKELMQEHFNENYVESDKYPKASFTGTIEGNIDVSREGPFPVRISGTLGLHNVSRPIELAATLQWQNGKLKGIADFVVKPEDYNISVPSIVRDKIAAQIKVHVDVDCSPQ